MKRLRTWLICRKHGIKKYTYNKDGSIDVHTSVYFDNVGTSKKLEKLPIKFNIVYGSFSCQNNNLSSFENFPKTINGQLNISNNKFVSLKGCPVIIGNFTRSHINCSGNNILSFEGLKYELFHRITLENNPINNIWNLFRDSTLIDLFNDYDIVRDDGELNMYRLDKFLEDNGYQPIQRHQWRILKGYKVVEYPNMRRNGKRFKNGLKKIKT